MNSTAEGRGRLEERQRSGKLETPNSKLETPNSKLETPNSKLETAIAELRTVYNVANPFHGPGKSLCIELQPPEMHETSGQHAYEAILARHGLRAHGFVQSAPWKSRFLRDIREISTGDMNVAHPEAPAAEPAQ